MAGKLAPNLHRVLFVSAESRPFASTGGLADVADALPNELNRSGLHVERIMPLYRRVVEGQGDVYQLERMSQTFMIPMGSEQVPAEIWAADLNGTRTYFVGREEYFDRTELYALPHREYSDNFERFLFFQKAVVAFVDEMGGAYDLLHLNDWQTGLIPLLLKHGVNGTGRPNPEPSLFTIHNPAYQGTTKASKFYLTNLPGSLSSYPELEFFGQINCMKAGIASSNRVTTVSPKYAEEIQTTEFGCGLDGLLRSLRVPVTGILNGVDYATWNTDANPELAAAYSADSLGGKEVCKQALVEEFGLEYKKNTPVFGLISRLVDQKGIDLLAETMERLMALPMQFILLGSGQQQYQDLCVEWQERWPERFGLFLGYDAGLSHRVEAGLDFFFMPSKFEPCGLNQLYSLRYGTLPIVNNVGGLADTVQDIRRSESEGTGYVMNAYRPENLLACVRSALDLFHDTESLAAIRQRGMSLDFSWTRTAETYRASYSELVTSD